MPTSPTAPMSTFPSIDNTPTTESASPNRLGASMAVTTIPSAPTLTSSQQYQLEKLKKSKVELSFSESTKAREYTSPTSSAKVKWSGKSFD